MTPITPMTASGELMHTTAPHTGRTVGPANSVVELVPRRTLRLTVNNEPVGEDLGIVYGSEATRDVFGQGECDDVFLELIELLGWRDELEAAAGALPAACQARLAKKQKK